MTGVSVIANDSAKFNITGEGDTVLLLQINSSQTSLFICS